MKKHSLFHEKQKIGEIERNGYVKNPQNAEKITPILDSLPAFLNNAIPEGYALSTAVTAPDELYPG
jgi:hypothetical protein